MRFWLLMFCVSPALAAEVLETPTFYFGSGKEIGTQGKVEDVIFLMGKRVVSTKEAKVTDTQVIVSKKAGIFEEVIRYDLGTHRVVIYVGKRSIGEGDFQADGEKGKWKKLRYKIRLNDPNQQSGVIEGTDSYGDGENFAVAEAKMLGQKGETTSQFSADLKVIDADLYETLHAKLLSSSEARVRGKGPRE